jgi:hypothetical protein
VRLHVPEYQTAGELVFLVTGITSGSDYRDGTILAPLLFMELTGAPLSSSRAQLPRLVRDSYHHHVCYGSNAENPALYNVG